MTDALMSAILSMDSYNRGYNPQVMLSGATFSLNKIGYADIVDTDGGTDAENVSFFAIAYDIDGKRVISYRGTDAPLGTVAQSWSEGDIFNGWIVGAGKISDQAIRAVNFYKKVSNNQNPGQDYRLADISLTGHSLGGGLAGLVASIYNKGAIVFDNMPFEAAASNLYTKALNSNLFADAVYGGGNDPWLTDRSWVSGYAVSGEMLENFRYTSSFKPTELSVLISTEK